VGHGLAPTASRMVVPRVAVAHRVEVVRDQALRVPALLPGGWRVGAYYGVALTTSKAIAEVAFRALGVGIAPLGVVGEVKVGVMAEGARGQQVGLRLVGKALGVASGIGDGLRQGWPSGPGPQCLGSQWLQLDGVFLVGLHQHSYALGVQRHRIVLLFRLAPRAQG
jgi:hypothetical protein